MVNRFQRCIEELTNIDGKIYAINIIMIHEGIYNKNYYCINCFIYTI